MLEAAMKEKMELVKDADPALLGENPGMQSSSWGSLAACKRLRRPCYQIMPSVGPHLRLSSPGLNALCTSKGTNQYKPNTNGTYLQATANLSPGAHMLLACNGSAAIHAA